MKIGINNLDYYSVFLCPFAIDYQSLRRICFQSSLDLKLGSVAGPVIQANGRLSFEDDLRSGGLLYCVSQ